MPTKKSKTEPNELNKTGLDNFLGKLALCEFAQEIKSVLVVTGLNDATIEGVVFSDEGDYVTGRPLSDGVYLILGLGKIPHALENEIHTIALEKEKAVQP